MPKHLIALRRRNEGDYQEGRHAARTREKIVNAIAQTGEIPAFKFRGQWGIRTSQLDQLIDALPRAVDGGGRGE